jgi:hypothetical protein
MYPKSLEPKKGPACGADFSLLRAISDDHPQATTFRDLGINSSSSAALTSTFRHFSSMHKPRDSMTAAFDDHGKSDDMDTEIQLDFPVLTPQRSLALGAMAEKPQMKEKKNCSCGPDGVNRHLADHGKS